LECASGEGKRLCGLRESANIAEKGMRGLRGFCDTTVGFKEWRFGKMSNARLQVCWARKREQGGVDRVWVCLACVWVWVWVAAGQRQQERYAQKA
jgi:hypothetical protein